MLFLCSGMVPVYLGVLGLLLLAMSDQYIEALEDLERLRAEGKVSQAQYDLHRQRLLAEATKPKRSKVAMAVLIVCAMVLAWLLLAFFSHIITMI